MGEFFMRIPCLNKKCCYHGGEGARIRVDAPDIEGALKELERFKKGQPPSENFGCKPKNPQLFMVVDVLIK